jgi:transcriptional regulator with XRE-family HTH domain
MTESARAALERLHVSLADAADDRTNLYEAIRAEHAAGTSYRQLAQELGISHQRIAQIVNEAHR